MLNLGKKRFFILFFVVFTSQIQAQLSHRIHEQLRFKYLTSDEGISDNRVRGLGQDNYGFIWIGTQYGVSRFDGYEVIEFSVFYNDTVGTPINFEETKDVFCDSYHNLWVVGTYGICYFDWSEGIFKQFYPRDRSFQIDDSRGIDEDKEGNLWFGTNAGIMRYNLETKEIKLWEQKENDVKFPPLGTLDKIEVSERGHIWFSLVRDGVGYFDIEKDVFFHFLPSDDPQSLAEEKTERLYEDSMGNIWIGHNNNGTSKYSYRTSKFTRYYPDPGLKEAGRVRGIIEDGQGNFWFGTQAGLYLFDRKTETFRRYAYADNPISTLSHNSIQVMMIDNQEGLWIGTFAGGVSYTNLNSSGIIKYEYSKIPSEYYLNDKSVYSLLFDKKENIWVGTENGGLNYLDRETGKFTYLIQGNGDENGTRSNNIKDMYIDENDLVWFGTYKGGMSYYNPRTNKFRHYEKRPEFPNGISDETVFIVYPDPIDNNLLWVGGADKLYKFNKTNETFTRISPETSGYINTPNISRIYGVAHNNDNIMAFATISYLIFLDRNSNTFFYQDKFNGNRIGHCDFVFFDKYGYLWAGVDNSYLVRYNIQDNKYIVINDSLGLEPVQYFEGIDDDNGNIWLSSNNGLYKLEGIIDNVDTVKLKHYDKSDNIQSMEFIYHSRAKSKSGEIAFGGINGFNSFWPDKVRPNPFKPNVIVSKLIIGGKEVKPGEKVFGKVILNKPIMETENVVFHYKIKLFTFHFNGFHFVAPENNQFRYKLEGYDEDWNVTGANVRSATYSNIPRGNYVFRVDASNNNGAWSEKPFSIEIKVTPPFWKTYWFYAIILIFLAFLVYLFIKWRERQLKHDRDILEEKLKKGQQEINNSKAEVARQAEELRQRDIAEKEQKWHNQGMIILGDVITKNKNNLKDLSKSFLSNLINYSEAHQGVIFSLNDDDDSNKFLEFLAGYALSKKKLNQKKIDIGEGLIGVCFKEKETMVVDDIPDGYTEVGSGVGAVVPKHIILFPLKMDEIVLGVIELSFINEIEEYKIRFIEKISEMFTSNLFSSKTNDKMKILLERSQQQAEEMQAQEEEMRQNMEEMQATQDEAARREQELINLNKEMEMKEKSFQKSIREKEKALKKAHEIIERQEKEIQNLKSKAKK